MKRYTQAPILEVSDDTILSTHSVRVQKLLLQRGIHTKEDEEKFLSPLWERDTHDPFLMKGMREAVLRIEHAILKKEQVCIWSDYDMDGIPGAVVLTDMFRAVGFKGFTHYTPHRNKEGFGLNREGLDELAEKGVTLIITVDCGSTDVEQVAYAGSVGMDVIITDHHLPPERLPEAYALLNPKQSDCSYPEPMLCGAGVAFKLMQGFFGHVRESETVRAPKEGREKWSLDMVGMATLADMVPLIGENRVFAYFGIVVLRKSPRVGLQALLKKARVTQHHLTEDDVSFTIAPRINAASRMGHARDAYALLVSEDESEAGVLSETLEKINKERKTVVATMKREIHRKLEKRGGERSVIVMGSPLWKPSLLGLVAGSLASEYRKPVFLWGREEGVIIKGSCRSGGEVNVYELMHAVSHQFIEYGGHAYSGGFSLRDEEVHTLEASLTKVHMAQEQVSGDGVGYYDDELLLRDVTWDTYREIATLAPFGEGNKKPVFILKRAIISGVRAFGKGGEHLEVTLKDENGATVKVIGFFTEADDCSLTPTVGARVSVVAHLEASYFFGRSELRLRLIDIVV